MARPQSQLTDELFDVSTPAVHPEVLVRHYGNEVVLWAVDADIPSYLDPIAALVFQMLDGTVSVAELIDDVHEVLGVPKGIVRNQLRRVVRQLEEGSLLSTSRSSEGPEIDVDLFTAPPNP